MVAGKFTSPASGRELKKKARSPSRGQLPLKLSLVKSRPIDLHRGDSSHQLSISQTDGMTFDGGLWFFGRSEKELAEARIAPVVCQLCLEGREEALPGSYFRMPWMRPKGRMAFEQGQEIFYNVQESDQVVAYRRSGVKEEEVEEEVEEEKERDIDVLIPLSSPSSCIGDDVGTLRGRY